MLRLGCAVWSHKGWVGQLFPEGTPSRLYLDLYSRTLHAVEGNTTFYATPDPETLQRWAEATPEGFHFCPKLPKVYSHEGPLLDTLPGALDFGRLMQQHLGSRLGPIFLQLPPAYSPRRLLDLTAFLQGWPHTELPLAVEVRNPEWFADPYQRRLGRLLASLNAGRVLLDTRPIYQCPDDPQLAAERRKPELPLQPVVTACFTFVRYIGHPDLPRNEPWLDEWAARVDAWLEQGIDVYFFAHCPDEDHSITIARRFDELMRRRRSDLPPIAWDLPAVKPPQLTLF
jgi:uncharacterized protein YecE (DUF72 family)